MKLFSFTFIAAFLLVLLAASHTATAWKPPRKPRCGRRSYRPKRRDPHACILKKHYKKVIVYKHHKKIIKWIPDFKCKAVRGYCEKDRCRYGYCKECQVKDQHTCKLVHKRKGYECKVDYSGSCECQTDKKDKKCHHHH